jgi:hypothetical protein
MPTEHSEALVGDVAGRLAPLVSGADLVDRAWWEDARHWSAHQRPIAAEALRRDLRIGAARSRMLVSITRAERSVGQDVPVAMVDQSKSG